MKQLVFKAPPTQKRQKARHSEKEWGGSSLCKKGSFRFFPHPDPQAGEAVSVPQFALQKAVLRALSPLDEPLVLEGGGSSLCKKDFFRNSPLAVSFLAIVKKPAHP